MVPSCKEPGCTRSTYGKLSHTTMWGEGKLSFRNPLFFHTSASVAPASTLSLVRSRKRRKRRDLEAICNRIWIEAKNMSVKEESNIFLNWINMYCFIMYTCTALYISDWYFICSKTPSFQSRGIAVQCSGGFSFQSEHTSTKIMLYSNLSRPKTEAPKNSFKIHWNSSVGITPLKINREPKN